MESKTEVVISSPYFIPGSMGVQEFGDLRKRNIKVTILTNSFASNDEAAGACGYARYRVELLRTGIDIYELSPTRIQRNERLMLPGASLGRLHAKTAVIDQSAVYIGSVNLDPRSESLNTELGIFARCPELAREVIRVINISKLQSSYRLRFAPMAETSNGWRRVIKETSCFPRSQTSLRSCAFSKCWLRLSCPNSCCSTANLVTAASIPGLQSPNLNNIAEQNLDQVYDPMYLSDGLLIRSPRFEPWSGSQSTCRGRAMRSFSNTHAPPRVRTTSKTRAVCRI